jgi:D-proline reductase (dithiol) PrdB
VGLIQNAIEGNGISTVSMTTHPYITRMVGAPRAIYMRFPQGNMIGQAFNPEQQRAILRTALEAVGTMKEPGTIMEYPERWRGSLRSK